MSKKMEDEFERNCVHLASPIRLSFAFVNSPIRESGRRGVVPLLPTVTTQCCVGVPVKRQQPIRVIIDMLHKTCFCQVELFSLTVM